RPTRPKNVDIVTHANKSVESASNQVRQLDEKCAAVSLQPGLELIVEWAVALVIQIVVVPHIQCCSRIRRPAQQKLPAHARGERVVIHARPRESESREIIVRAK